MAWSDLTDLANTACRSVFGESVTIGGEAITALYINEVQELMPPGAQAPVISSRPFVEYRDADLVSQPVAGTVVVAGGVTYKVLKVLPADGGWTKLHLREST